VEEGWPFTVLLLFPAIVSLYHCTCRDDAKARALLLQAAIDEGWPDALDVLGNAYAAGAYGFETSLAKAVPLYEHAAHLGVPQAMFKVANAYKWVQTRQVVFQHALCLGVFDCVVVRCVGHVRHAVGQAKAAEAVGM
jgi:hypothetical protein